jgi:hypothetical protein
MSCIGGLAASSDNSRDLDMGIGNNALDQDTAPWMSFCRRIFIKLPPAIEEFHQ